jgi:formylglycine-generating enzyme required for sulfatase activity/tRNA A-37 threonylcarbamoyl transferase component Bud32
MSTDQPSQPEGQPPKTPQPRRTTIGTDPTMPISLRRQAEPAPEVVEPAATPPAAADSHEEGWSGSEQTLVGVPPPGKEGSDRLPIVLVEDDSSGWIGAERTTVPIARPPGSGAAEDDSSGWLGADRTMVGGPVPDVVPASGSGDAWLGSDATVIGTPAPSAKTPGQQGDTTNRGGQRRTHSTMDDGWHLKGRQGPLTGKTVGDYEVGGILGEGGMGTVYRAKQISLKRRVALKVLPPNLSSNAQLRQRFEQEAHTASLLNSPHVVQVFAAGNHEDMVYFVMEYVEGTDLSEKIREKNDAAQLFTPDEAANYVIQAARGLAEAGKHNIVHRDIKPANLMITAKGVLKIADFGISKIAGEHGLTMTGTAVGTPAYCSPEQGRGDQVDVRADIYSIGVVFYELLTGRKPFDGATANALIYQHNYAEPTLITALRAEVPDAYQAVALKCLQKDPAKRYQDAAELVSDLERVRAGSAPMTALMNAFGTGADEAMRRLGIKQRRIWPYIAAALVLVAVIAGVVVWQTRHTAEQQSALSEIARLRGNLVVLDRAEPVGKGSRDDLASLALLVPADDTDLVRWQGKLGRVEQLQVRLARLDAVELPPAALRAEAASDLDRYREDVGGAGEDVVRWQARLDAARDAATALRSTLGELDQTPVVSNAMAERLMPPLAQLTVLAGDADEDVKRWQGRIGASRDRATTLRVNLAALDQADAPLNEAQLATLDQDLAALRAIVGTEDAGVRGWSTALTARRETIAGLRKNLARLDAVEWATTSLQAALANDLAQFTKVADANDPDLKRWTGKMNDSAERIVGLRKTLARLDRPEALTITEQQQTEEQLTIYRSLVSPDDGQLQAWTARLRAEQEAIRAMTATLGRFDNDARMTVVELDAADTAVKELGRLGALAEARQRLYERRLNEERQALNTLRQTLRARDGSTVTIDQQLVADLNLLARLAGEDDEDVKRWRTRVNDYERLRAILVVIDQTAPLPDDVAKHIDAFIAIAGLNPDVRRWREKIARVQGLRERLEPLGRVEPLPENALADAQALVGLVGEQDLQAKRWLDKATRVHELIATLQQQLAGAYVLPPQAPKQRDELLALVGAKDEVVAGLATRVAILIGPGRPAWASSAGRDESGLWAELTIKGVAQRFRYVPAGSFLMGSPEDEPGRDRDETQVRVNLSQSFWLADTECTQGFWAVVAGVDDSRFKGLERPVERLSWDDAKGFCVSLSTQVPGLRARLPTEAEWEYACRAGVAGAYASHIGAVGLDKLDTIAWFAGTTSMTQGVKRRFGNALALFDMHGNVWEWCEDRYGTYSPTTVTDPVGREQETRVARGGSWGDRPDRLRAANRLAVRQDMRTLYLGIRLAVAVDWPEGQEPVTGNNGLLPASPLPAGKTPIDAALPQTIATPGPAPAP